MRQDQRARGHRLPVGGAAVKRCDCSLCRARRDLRFAGIVGTSFTRRELERLDDLVAPPNASLRARVGAYTMGRHAGNEQRSGR